MDIIIIIIIIVIIVIIIISLSVAILGFHGMLNQVQYHQAFVEGGEQKGSKSGFQGMLFPLFHCRLLTLENGNVLFTL